MGIRRLCLNWGSNKICMYSWCIIADEYWILCLFETILPKWPHCWVKYCYKIKQGRIYSMEQLIHWGLIKIVDILQVTFSNAFLFRCEIPWTLFWILWPFAGLQVMSDICLIWPLDKSSCNTGIPFRWQFSLLLKHLHLHKSTNPDYWIMYILAVCLRGIPFGPHGCTFYWRR